MTLQVKWMSLLGRKENETSSWMGFRIPHSFLIVPLTLASVTLMPIIALADDPRVTKQLQDQLEKTKGTFGKIPQWQEEIFSNEILSSSGRFIKDYVAKNGKVSNVVVDESSLKRYLNFHADLAGIQGETRKTLLSVSLEGECDSCVQTIPLIRKDWKEKLIRRGLDPIVLTPAESKKDPSDLLAQKGAGSWVQLKVIAEKDPDHPADALLRTKLEVKFPGTQLNTVQREVEVPSGDTIDVTVSRLYIEGITQLGADAQKITAVDSGETSFKVNVKKIQSFNGLQEAKSMLQSFEPSARVVEYQITKQETIFAVSPASSRSKFLSKLKSGKSKVIGDENAELLEVQLPLTVSVSTVATETSESEEE
jgi:hypothetical protein